MKLELTVVSDRARDFDQFVRTGDMLASYRAQFESCLEQDDLREAESLLTVVSRERLAELVQQFDDGERKYNREALYERDPDPKIGWRLSKCSIAEILAGFIDSFPTSPRNPVIYLTRLVDVVYNADVTAPELESGCRTMQHTRASSFLPTAVEIVKAIEQEKWAERYAAAEFVLAAYDDVAKMVAKEKAS